ncbi:MAG TPA: DUF885 domain-containing protein [Thermoanaerobaculia bacterium]
MRKLALLLLLALPASAAQPAYVTALADAYMAAYYERFPEQATMAGIAGARHDRVTDNSAAGIARWQAVQDAFLTLLAEVDPNTLWGSPEWITHGFLRETLEASRGTRVCRSELWPVNQMSGWQVGLANLANGQPVTTDEQRRAAIARFSALPKTLENEMTNLREGLRLGYSTPRRNVGLVVEQLDKLLATPVADSPFFSPAKRANDPAFTTQWTALVSQTLYPAIARYRDFLRDEYQPKARVTIAVKDHPNGVDCYRAAYRSYSTLRREPQEVFDLGMRTVKANETKMRALGKELFGTDDLAAIKQRIRTDRENKFATRDEVRKFAEESVARAKAAVPRWFGIVPKTDVVIQPIPEYREKTASDSYQRASDDGSRPGTYHIKLYQPEEQQRGVVERTAFHETYPGHHLQIAIAQERTAVHPITRFVGNSGFSEGWARYTEALSEEMKLYATKHGRVGRLGWPARGMVIDPGILVLGWTREQAIAFALESGTMTEESASSLVDRVVVWPAQLTAYDSGGLEITALREQAEKALGQKFDIRKFHDAVLGDGSVTLPMLRTKIERWIEEQRLP